MPERLAIKDVELYMRNVRTRMPFKYGVATLTSVPILHLKLTAELADGTAAVGYAADILPPKWFDKDPDKEYEQNVEDLLLMARSAATAYGEAAATPRSVFDIWRDGYRATLEIGDASKLNHLTASHGSSLMERALIDALGVARDQSYHSLLTTNALGIDFAALHTELAGMEPRDIIASRPLEAIAIRHTVGLGDPIHVTDVAAENRLDDGLPQALEEYARTQRLTYFKVKVSGEIDADLERLREVAGMLATVCGDDYWITLDGNEQFKEMESFEALVNSIRSDDGLQRFFERIVYIEQPLDRSIALNEDVESGVRAVAKHKPMLVDESDGDLDSFEMALQRGYTGVSTKNCKGLIKALTNLALAKLHTEKSGVAHFLSAEDLMNLPVVPVHQDLTHIAALGIGHAERNGHHYVRGLDHLSASERAACARVHGSLYGKLDSTLAMKITEGSIDVTSLQVPGLGLGMPTDTSSMIPLHEWSFESL
jgi:hypothetical protein